jgi:hypothetical protein
MSSGGTRGFILTVINEDETEAHFRLYITDIMKTSKGELQFPPPGSTTYSCANDIWLETASFHLPPYGKKEIRGTVSLPSRALGGRYAMVMCELVPEEVASEGIVIAPRWRIGSIIKATVMGTERNKVNIAKFAHFPPSEKNGRKFIVTVANEGNVCIKGGKGNMSIVDNKKRIVQRLTLEAEKTIFPESEEEITVFTKRPLPAGQYTAVAAIEYQGKIRSPSKEINFIVEEEKFSEVKISDDQAQIGIIIEPKTIELEMPQGSFRTSALTISNQEEFSFNIKIEMKDISYTDQGEEKLLELGKTAYSLKEIAIVEPKEFIITPHGKKNIRVALSIPKSSIGGLYGKLIFNCHSINKDYIFSGRKEVAIAIAISKTIRKAGKIDDVKVIFQKDEGIECALKFQNNSNVLLKPKGEVKIENMGFKEVAKALLGEVTVMPGEIVNMRANCPQLPAGKYNVIVNIKYGEKEEKLFWNGEIRVK